ncbi:hypothetical protein K1728_01825 [Weissella confusa]|uniref:hypothetical protein n=1 Tax=Weissella confusa TaxID=1583 RepID=UPI001C6F8D3D|nr:hypothetical protein [Weissella confusa]QYU58176.1 hypothetical protein K1728_01825 [Weissella confusa]
MARKKPDIPLQERVWVDVVEAAGLLGYGEEIFNQEIRSSKEFVEARIERREGRFSRKLLEKWGNGEFD